VPNSDHIEQVEKMLKCPNITAATLSYYRAIIGCGMLLPLVLSMLLVVKAIRLAVVGPIDRKNAAVTLFLAGVLLASALWPWDTQALPYLSSVVGPAVASDREFMLEPQAHLYVFVFGITGVGDRCFQTNSFDLDFSDSTAVTDHILKIVRIHGSGHFVHLESPDEVLSAVLSLLQGQ
jgi:hypothetical protein